MDKVEPGFVIMFFFIKNLRNKAVHSQLDHFRGWAIFTDIRAVDNPPTAVEPSHARLLKKDIRFWKQLKFHHYATCREADEIQNG
jgi:hypothetical protein